MSKPKPKCTLTVNFDSGKRFRIDLYNKYVWSPKRIFEIKFTDETGEARMGTGTISHLVDRLRRLLVKELR